MRNGSGPQHSAKVAFPAAKADWHPSVLPGPIVLVSTAGRRRVRVDRCRQADRGPWHTEQPLSVVELYDPPGGRDAEAHVAFLRSLRESGVLLMAGPYDGRVRSRTGRARAR